MRFATWNCCWKLNLPALLAEAPDIAVIQECSRKSLENLPDGYRGQWLAGTENHGLGMIYRAPFELLDVEVASSTNFFAKIEIAGPVSFRLIAAWNCPPEKSGNGRYIAYLHQFLDQQGEWFQSADVVFAGDLNSQQGKSFDVGLRRHTDLEKRLNEVGLVDAYAAVREVESPEHREPTYRHQRKHEQPFHIDYIFLPASWISRILSLSVGATEFWSRLSDHSPLILTIV